MVRIGNRRRTLAIRDTTAIRRRQDGGETREDHEVRMIWRQYDVGGGSDALNKKWNEKKTRVGGIVA